ncbi:hypothetical protein N8J89_16645 [Crossiella sp. CA-258035]|uniref:hypothetical protein n=1 Tax=Crossiella sp. CA-258035 TaxID=2981138 RepID=UPI0024BC94E0|nr:hypothetical protein [Crossiella sp. CA-258035]WHT22627.1 hypothetical protein N8J89_16645 [Crossiella sp. CA-258035]
MNQPDELLPPVEPDGPELRQHNPDCPGCRDYAVVLAREQRARLAYYESGLAHFDDLHDLRRRVVGHLKARHPLRTERLKRLGNPLGEHSANSTLVAALSQWDAMRDAEIRGTVAASVEEELRLLRQRNTDLERQLAQHTELRQRDEQSSLDRVRGLREQLEKATSALTEAEQHRRELSRGIERLADHITTRGLALPTLLHPDEWYRQWTDRDHQPRSPRNRAGARESRWPALAKAYQPQWGQPVLQRLWSGAAWSWAQVLGVNPAPRLRRLLDGLAEHGLVTLHDPEVAALLTVTDDLRDFADDVGAVLGPRKPSPALVALATTNLLPESLGPSLLRALAAATRDHQVSVAHRKSGALPLFRLRERQGVARWLLPWLPGQEPLLRELLTRARGRDAEAGLVVAGVRAEDEEQCTELLRAAGYDPRHARCIAFAEPPTTSSGVS